MPFYWFVWTDEIIEHLAQHGVTREEFAAVVCNPQWQGNSASSGRPMATGWTEEGRYLLCVYEFIDEVTILPVTAYEPDEE